MKRIIALILATLICVFSFTGCGKDPADDLANVQKAGKLVVGITSFAPMDFKDDNGEWIGFDADLAKAFAKELGVEVEFREIEWDNKVLELDSYKVDVIWNGMTLTEEVTAAMDCTNAYCNNQQVIIVPKDKAADFATPDSIKDVTVAVEKGSAGQTEATAKGAKIKEVADQATALAEVKSGNAEAAVIDSLMAAAMVGEGTDYADLTYTAGLNSEEYGVGFRKGSDLTEKLNDFFKKYYESGEMTKLADKYGVTAALIEQK